MNCQSLRSIPYKYNVSRVRFNKVICDYIVNRQMEILNIHLDNIFDRYSQLAKQEIFNNINDMIEVYDNLPNSQKVIIFKRRIYFLGE